MQLPLDAPAPPGLRLDHGSKRDDADVRTEWLGSGDRRALGRWDAFLLDSPRGHYCQLSTWLRSFEPYGFRVSVLTARAAPGGAIVGGIGFLEFGNRVLGLMSAPIGPIVHLGYEGLVARLLEESVRRA